MVKKLTLSLSKSNTSKLKRKLTRDQIENEIKEIKKPKKPTKAKSKTSTKKKAIPSNERNTKIKEISTKNDLEEEDDEVIDIEGLDDDEDLLFYPDSNSSFITSPISPTIFKPKTEISNSQNIYVISDESDQEFNSIETNKLSSPTLIIEDDINDNEEKIEEEKVGVNTRSKRNNNNSKNKKKENSPSKSQTSTKAKNKKTPVKKEVKKRKVTTRTSTKANRGKAKAKEENSNEEEIEIDITDDEENLDDTYINTDIENDTIEKEEPNHVSLVNEKTEGIKYEISESEMESSNDSSDNDSDYEVNKRNNKKKKRKSSPSSKNKNKKSNKKVKIEEKEGEEKGKKEEEILVINEEPKLKKNNKNITKNIKTNPEDKEEGKKPIRRSNRIKNISKEIKETIIKPIVKNELEPINPKEEIVEEKKPRTRKSNKTKDVKTKDTKKNEPTVKDNSKEIKSKYFTKEIKNESIEENTKQALKEKLNSPIIKQEITPEIKKEIKEEVIQENDHNLVKPKNDMDSDINKEQNDDEENNKDIIKKEEEENMEKVKEDSEFLEDGFEEVDFEEIEFEENFQWDTKTDKEKGEGEVEERLLRRKRREFASETPKLEDDEEEEENESLEITEISQAAPSEENIKDQSMEIVAPTESVDPEKSIDEGNINIEVEIEGEESQQQESEIKQEEKETKSITKRSKGPPLKIKIDEFKLMNSLSVEDNFSEESEDEDDGEEWEQIEISTKQNTPKTDNESKLQKLSSSDDLLLSQQSITITFDKEELKKKKNKGINKYDRIVRELTHQVNLLFLLGTCKAWNNWSNSEKIRCLSLSVLPTSIIKIVENNHKLNLDDFYSTLKQFCEWFRTFAGLAQSTDGVNEEDSIMNHSTSSSTSKSRTRSRSKSKGNDISSSSTSRRSRKKSTASEENSSSTSRRSRRKSATSEDDKNSKKSKSTKKNKGKKKMEDDDDDDDDDELENKEVEKVETEEEKESKKFLIKNSVELELLFEEPRFIERFANAHNLYIIMFVALARTAGFRCNYVASLHPIPLSFAKKKTTNNEAVELWTEIYCKQAKRWVPVNPLNKHSVYPMPKQLITSDFNELSYVITIDYDGFVKERTRRYAKDFLTYTRKLRLKNNAKWWEVNIIKRYFSSNVIDDSDEEVPDEEEEKQPLPTSIGGFLNHPLYVLERHIKKYEVLYQKEPILGYIRNEAIYPRNNVRPVNTKEYWIRQGLSIKEGAEPAKYVKSKVYTIKKKRMIEFSKQNAAIGKDFNLGDEMVPLYGDWQTEPYVSPPVKDGIVPKSEFGNIDMFKPSMLPAGGTHLQIQGLAPLARKLNIDYANAVIGFDFHLGHCVPVIDGIVVATENVDLLLSKFEEFELEKFKKFMAKREKRILSNWRRLVRGLLTREELREKYGKKKDDDEEEDSENPETSGDVSMTPIEIN